MKTNPEPADGTTQSAGGLTQNETRGVGRALEPRVACLPEQGEQPVGMLGVDPGLQRHGVGGRKAPPARAPDRGFPRQPA